MIDTVVLELPPELFAYIVYVTWVEFTLGVPLITPFENVNPEGRAGSISHVATAPPVFDATTSVIVTPLVKVWSEIVPRLAAGSLIEMVNVSLSEPPELFAYRV